MFLQLTKFDTIKSEFTEIYINFRKVQYFIREGGKTLTVVSLGRNFYLVRETPEQIESLLSGSSNQIGEELNGNK